MPVCHRLCPKRAGRALASQFTSEKGDLALTGKEARVVAHGERCHGCQICQLICSFVHEKVFNPAKASIHVERLAGETEFGVTLTPQCDNCGVCIQYCLYGALSREVLDEEDQE